MIYIIKRIKRSKCPLCSKKTLLSDKLIFVIMVNSSISIWLENYIADSAEVVYPICRMIITLIME